MPRTEGFGFFCFGADNFARSFFAIFAKNNRTSTTALAVTSVFEIGQAVENQI
jgi:hypothetical protein